MQSNKRGKHFANPSTPAQPKYQSQQANTGRKKKFSSMFLKTLLIIVVIFALVAILTPKGPITVVLFDVIDNVDMKPLQKHITDGLEDCGYIKMSSYVEGNTVTITYTFDDGINPIVEYRVHQVIHDDTNAANARSMLMDAADVASSEDEVLEEGARVICNFQGPAEEHVATATFTRNGLESSDDKEVTLTLEDIMNIANADNEIRAAMDEQMEAEKSQLAEVGVSDFSFTVSGNEIDIVCFFDDNMYSFDSDAANATLHDEAEITTMKNFLTSCQQDIDKSNLGITGVTCRYSFQGIDSGEVFATCLYSVDGIVE